MSYITTLALQALLRVRKLNLYVVVVQEQEKEDLILPRDYEHHSIHQAIKES